MDVDNQRLMIKVARLYHTHGLRQTAIARRLRISQSRVSRLLTQAEEAAIVRTIVAVPRDIHADLEEEVEGLYGVSDVYVVDAVSDDDGELALDLANAMAGLLNAGTLDATTVGFTSWSKTLRLMVDSLQPIRATASTVVETLGDLGPPQLQHEAERATRGFAALIGAEPVMLRTPGVLGSSEVRQALVDRDKHVQDALAALDNLDLVFVGIGSCYLDPALRSGDNFFTDEQFATMRHRGAVGEVCLHFIDADGAPVTDGYDHLVTGITTEQMRAARRRWAVAGGSRKHQAVRAALAGRWVDTLVTDVKTAQYLVDTAPPHPPGHA
jgi:DNA-binding transcriptional regulator LsrR (DeoR family)